MSNGELFIAENPNIEFKLNGSCVWIYFDGVNHYTMPVEWWEQEVSLFDKLRAEILEEKECAYADFNKYKVDYLGVDSRYVEDELPYDDFRYGMERCIEIIDRYMKGE